jgi:hypothetical protein
MEPNTRMYVFGRHAMVIPIRTTAMEQIAAQTSTTEVPWLGRIYQAQSILGPVRTVRRAWRTNPNWWVANGTRSPFSMMALTDSMRCKSNGHAARSAFPDVGDNLCGARAVRF